MIKYDIMWDRDKYNRLYADVHHAIHDEGMDDEHVIMFDGHKMVLGYAKYLLEYLDQALTLCDRG
jgi:hypothetical protein